MNSAGDTGKPISKQGNKRNGERIRPLSAFSAFFWYDRTSLLLEQSDTTMAAHAPIKLKKLIKPSEQSR